MWPSHSPPSTSGAQMMRSLASEENHDDVKVTLKNYRTEIILCRVSRILLFSIVYIVDCAVRCTEHIEDNNCNTHSAFSSHLSDTSSPPAHMDRVKFGNKSSDSSRTVLTLHSFIMSPHLSFVLPSNKRSLIKLPFVKDRWGTPPIVTIIFATMWISWSDRCKRKNTAAAQTSASSTLLEEHLNGTFLQHVLTNLQLLHKHHDSPHKLHWSGGSFLCINIHEALHIDRLWLNAGGNVEGGIWRWPSCAHL